MCVYAEYWQLDLKQAPLVVNADYQQVSHLVII